MNGLDGHWMGKTTAVQWLSVKLMAVHVWFSQEHVKSKSAKLTAVYLRSSQKSVGSKSLKFMAVDLWRPQELSITEHLGNDASVSEEVTRRWAHSACSALSRFSSVNGNRIEGDFNALGGIRGGTLSIDGWGFQLAPAIASANRYNMVQPELHQVGMPPERHLTSISLYIAGWLRSWISDTPEALLIIITINSSSKGID